MWYKDQTVYANGKYTLNPRVEALMNNSIVLKNVQADDAGNYYCEVYPENIRLHVLLQINKALTITCDDRDVVDRTIIYRQGESHVCVCKTTGSSETEIKWSLNVSLYYIFLMYICIFIKYISSVKLRSCFYRILSIDLYIKYTYNCSIP